MPGKRSVADDEDEDLEDDAPVETESGGAQPTSQGSDLGESILDATLGLVRLSILLSEANADAWAECAPRLGQLFAALDSVPRQAPQPRRVGFEPPKPTRPRGAKRGRGRS